MVRGEGGAERGTGGGRGGSAWRRAARAPPRRGSPVRAAVALAAGRVIAAAAATLRRGGEVRGADRPAPPLRPRPAPAPPTWAGEGRAQHARGRAIHTAQRAKCGGPMGGRRHRRRSVARGGRFRRQGVPRRAAPNSRTATAGPAAAGNVADPLHPSGRRVCVGGCATPRRPTRRASACFPPIPPEAVRVGGRGGAPPPSRGQIGGGPRGTWPVSTPPAAPHLLMERGGRDGRSRPYASRYRMAPSSFGVGQCRRGSGHGWPPGRRRARDAASSAAARGGTGRGGAERVGAWCDGARRGTAGRVATRGTDRGSLPGGLWLLVFFSTRCSVPAGWWQWNGTREWARRRPL